MADKDELEQFREEFEECAEAAADNEKAYCEDVRFARLAEQWPEGIKKERDDDERPCLTINMLPTLIRQVVNDNRANKPQIKVHPVDSQGDPETAKLFAGRIRNIEYASDADVAYDTGVECAVTGGFGVFRIGLQYGYGDSFDMEISIDRVPDPTMVKGDPNSTAADSSDWNIAFAAERMKKAAFERRWKGAKAVDWDGGTWADMKPPWLEGDYVLTCERWFREEADYEILLLSNGQVVGLDVYNKPEVKYAFDLEGASVVSNRTSKRHKVTQKIMSGAEVLERKDWAGCYIPIVPIYGDEVFLDGKRHLRSLIRDAKDPQRMFNYWRSASTEMVALAPKAPYIGPVGAFASDHVKWNNINRKNYGHVEYDPVPGAPDGGRPTRQQFDGSPVGALQEALNASDDVKRIIGIFDASIGARSNETSGVAINARDRQADRGTFHFSDNVNRAIRHAGRILLDLIPHVDGPRQFLRVLGEDGTPRMQQMKTPVPVTNAAGQPVMGEDGNPMTRVYDLGVGKYDLTVKAGPSYDTMRQEAAYQMTEFVRAVPQAAAIIGDLIAKNLDWPGADEIAERLKALNPAAQQQGADVEQIREVATKLGLENQELVQENARLRGSNAVDMAKAATAADKVEVDAFNARTKRMEAVVKARQPQKPAQYSKPE